MKDILMTIVAYIIFILLCAMCVGILILILKFVGWLLTFEYIRNTLLILCFIASAAMLYEEFRKEE